MAFCGLLAAGAAFAQDEPGHEGHNHGPGGHDNAGHVVLNERARAEAAQLVVQDFQGRMKPLDTLAREMSMKVTKSTKFEGRDPLDMMLAFAVQPTYWWSHPVIAVRNPGVKKLIGAGPDVKHVSAASLFEGETYKLQDEVEAAHRTPAGERDKTQQQLITFDERLHMLYLSLQGNTLRLYPVPGDPNKTWLGISEVAERLNPQQKAEYDAAFAGLFGGLQSGDQTRVLEGIRLTRELQQKYGADALPSGAAVKAELILNKLQPFVWSTLPYLGGFAVLMVAFFYGLLKRDGKPWAWRHPLYLTGMVLFLAGLVLHTYGYVLRWIASGRAPLANGHESLLFIALAVGFAGLIFELANRQAAAASLGSLLTAVVLGVSMMGTFDPAIGPLVPVLASYWLNIHVTIITASYGFLGLSALLGALTLVLFMVEATRRRDFGPAVAKLDRLNVAVMVTGLGMLAIGTYLGGVWANESWGRYWGWDRQGDLGAGLDPGLCRDPALPLDPGPAQRVRAGRLQPGRDQQRRDDLLRRELLPQRPAQLRRRRGRPGAVMGLPRLGDHVRLHRRGLRRLAQPRGAAHRRRRAAPAQGAGRQGGGADAVGSRALVEKGGGRGASAFRMRVGVRRSGFAPSVTSSWSGRPDRPRSRAPGRETASCPPSCACSRGPEAGRTAPARCRAAG